MDDRIDRDKAENSTIQNNSENAKGFQTIAQGGTVYIGETHIHIDSDRSNVASQPNLEMTLTDAQRQRLVTERDSLQTAWDLASQKLDRLRKAYAIESGIAVKFQLEQQIVETDVEINRLNDRLNEIELRLITSQPIKQFDRIGKIEILEFPESVVPLNSKFYMEPDGRQIQCQQAIIQPGGLLRIQAPGQMGKTSLLARLVDYARGLNYHIVRVDLRDADAEILLDLDLLLQWLSQQVCDCLNLPIEVAENWKNRGGSKSTCTNFGSTEPAMQV